MKKICLLVALAVVLSCCVFALAACGGDEGTTSSAATSSTESSKENSSAAATSSEATPSETPSDDESSDVPDESSAVEDSSETSVDKNPEAKPNTEGVNLALNKTYTKAELFRAGGAEVNWGWDPNAAEAYPDEDNKTLTDGLLPPDDASYQDAAWFGFNSNTPSFETDGGYAWITLDLGESYELKKAVLHVGGSGLQQGIVAPASVEYLVSEDGKEFTSVGTAIPTDGDGVVNTEATLEFDATGRYVQVRILPGNCWMFVSELEVF